LAALLLWKGGGASRQSETTGGTSKKKKPRRVEAGPRWEVFLGGRLVKGTAPKGEKSLLTLLRISRSRLGEKEVISEKEEGEELSFT